MIQLSPDQQPKTLMDAIRYFDPERAEAYVESVKWADTEPCCAKCGSVNVRRLKSRPLYQCRDCRKQTSIKVGTIFQDSAIGLDKWLVGIWMIATCRNGVSSCEIARTIGIKQQSAWHLLHRVREAMKPAYMHKLKGIVETDESFIGGRIRYMHKHRADKLRSDFSKNKGKTLVQIFLERDGEVRGKVIPKLTKRHIHPGIRENVERGSKLYSDSLAAYAGLESNYEREWVNHMIAYARGAVHVNSCENFFSLLRRALKGTYVAVDPEHLVGCPRDPFTEPLH